MGRKPTMNPKEADSKLAKCPFCGKKAELLAGLIDFEAEIICTNPYCDTILRNKKCGNLDMDEFIKKWNNRSEGIGDLDLFVGLHYGLPYGRMMKPCPLCGSALFGADFHTKICDDKVQIYASIECHKCGLELYERTVFPGDLYGLAKNGIQGTGNNETGRDSELSPWGKKTPIHHGDLKAFRSKQHSDTSETDGTVEVRACFKTRRNTGHYRTQYDRHQMEGDQESGRNRKETGGERMINIHDVSKEQGCIKIKVGEARIYGDKVTIGRTANFVGTVLKIFDESGRVNAIIPFGVFTPAAIGKIKKFWNTEVIEEKDETDTEARE